MKYYHYNFHDLFCSSKDGNYQFNIFSEFIIQLLIGEYLEYKTGIAKYTQANGKEGLSLDKGKILNHIISWYKSNVRFVIPS